MSDIIHFETLWDSSEKLAVSKYTDFTDTKILEELSKSIAAYSNAITTDLPSEVKLEFKKRIIGHMTFIITALSAREDVNVYRLLKEEMELVEFDLSNAKTS